MSGTRELLRPHRFALLALGASVMLHAAAILGIPGQLSTREEGAAVIYKASLEAVVEPGTVAPTPAPPQRAAPKPKPRAKPRPPRPEEMIAQVPVETPLLAPEPQPEPEAAKAGEPPPQPEKVALAEPIAPPAPTPPPLETFRPDAIPGNIEISYELTSSFADGRATYEWKRDGDTYVISGEAEAVGFFTLFLEGRIRQESRGKVTSEGLRPERFVEQRPNASEEGLEFDWGGRKVTFERKGEKTTSDLNDNTVDWLSMIFQMAHQPPKGNAFEMRVFTQRRLYQFKLRILGEEELDLPIGRVRALHLRHVDEAKQEYVDVWLGVDQHYVPVKLRYPVARNRVMVEQTATRITAK